jgi:hypothetical protein
MFVSCDKQTKGYVHHIFVCLFVCLFVCIMLLFLFSVFVVAKYKNCKNFVSCNEINVVSTVPFLVNTHS